MAQYDGAIRINTKINTKDAKTQLSSLAHVIVGTANEISSLRSKMDAMKNVKFPTKEFTNLEAEIKKAASEYEKLQEKMKKSEKPTKEYTDAQKEVDKYGNALQKAKEKIDKLLALGFDQKSNAFVSAQYDVAKFENKLLDAEEAVKRLEQEGKAFAPTMDTKELDEAKKKVDDLKQKMKELKASGKDTVLGKDTDAYKNLAKQLKNEQKALAKYTLKFMSTGVSGILSGAKGGFKRLAEVVKGTFSKINRSAKKSSSLLGTLGSRFKGLALSLLIFNQISKAFNAMISGMKEGFGNLYKEVNGFKNSVNSLKASILTLKNSFAAAFRPLVETAIPYIQKTVDAMANLLDTIGQFTAAITGQKTYTKAVRQTADAIEDENKAQNRQLSSLDKLNNLTTSSGSGSGDGTDKMFEENVPIESGVSEAADRIKKIFSEVFDTLKKAWKKKGKKVVDSAKKSLRSLGDVAKSVGETFYETFTSEVGLDWVESLLDRFNSILDTIGLIADAFSTAWDGGAGEENVKALFDMLTDINRLLKNIRDSFNRAFSGGIGTKIFENVLGTLTGIYNTIGNIASGIQEAWDTAGLGNRIWGGILEIINTILETFHNIVNSTAEWAENLDFTPLLESIDGLLLALQPLTENIGEGLEWFWNNVLLPIAGWVIEDAVPTFLDMLSAAISALNAVIETLEPLGTWLWGNFLQPLGEWAGDVFIGAMETATSLLSGFTDLLTENEDVANTCSAAIDILSEAWNWLIDILTPLGEFLSDTFVSIWNDMIEPALSYLGETVLPTLINTFENLWNNVLVPFAEFLGSILKPAIKLISYFLKKLWEKVVVPLADFLGGVFSTAFEGVAKIYNETVIPITKKLISAMKRLWEKVLKPIAAFLEDTFKPVFDTVFDAIERAIGGLKEAFQGIINFIVDVFTGNWESAWEKVTGIFEGVKNTISGIIDGIVDAIEWVLEKIGVLEKSTEKSKRDLPDIWKTGATPAVTLGRNAVQLPKIPGYATGQVIPRTMQQHLAILGDNNRETEVVSPLSTIEQAVTNALRKNGGIGGWKITIEIPFIVDGRELTRVVKTYDQEYFNKTGMGLFAH